MSSLCYNYWRSYASFLPKNIGYTPFSTLFSYMFSHIELKFCTWLCYNVLQIKFKLGQFLNESCLFYNLEYRKYAVFAIFSFMFDILSWNFAYDFVLMYYRSSSNVVTVSIFEGVLPLFKLRIQEICNLTHFFYMLRQIELKFCIWLCFTLLQI